MTVCFTGHREIRTAELLWLRARLADEVERLVASGAVCFRTGGALGFDTEAALAVLRQKEKTPHVRLELFLPCPDQCARWSLHNRELYEKIRAHANSFVYLSDYYYRGVMQVRNRALVDGADVCVAFLRSGASGGTDYTVNYAKKHGVTVINLSDRL